MSKTTFMDVEIPSNLHKYTNLNLITSNYLILSLLTIFVFFYGMHFSPELNKNIHGLFHQNWFRAIVFFLILYLTNHNLLMSLAILIVYMILFIGIQNYNLLNKVDKYTKYFTNEFNKEKQKLNH